MLEIKVDHEYNTRSGGKLKITSKRWDVYTGNYTSPDGNTTEITVNAQGRYYYSGKQSGYDIISEYQAPSITYSGYPFNLGGP